MSTSVAAKTREEAKKETRDRLVAAGVAAVAAEGLDASLDGICERAGYTRGAFYVHFEDRDDFLRAVMDKVGADFLDAVLGTTEGADLFTVAARFLSAVASGDYPLMSERGVKPHQLLDACARSTAVRDRYVELANESVSRMARAVRRSQKDAKVRDDVDAKTIATLLLALIIGAQTMNELTMPMDLAKNGAALLRLLSPQKRR